MLAMISKICLAIKSRMTTTSTVTARKRNKTARRIVKNAETTENGKIVSREAASTTAPRGIETTNKTITHAVVIGGMALGLRAISCWWASNKAKLSLDFTRVQKASGPGEIECVPQLSQKSWMSHIDRYGRTYRTSCDPFSLLSTLKYLESLPVTGTQLRCSANLHLY